MSEPTDVGVKSPKPPTYLGDGLYAQYDGYQIRLYADGFMGRVQEVYLDSATLQAFEQYVKELKGE